MQAKTRYELDSPVRVTVSYCVRCGTLRIHPEEDSGAICDNCRRKASRPLAGGRP